MPLIFILLLSALSSFNSSMMHHRDRILPYVFSAFSIFMGARLLAKLPIPGLFSVFMTGACFVLIILFLVTIKWKISGHAAGMGGLLGMLLATTFKYGLDLSTYLIIFLIISGAIGTARVYLNKHTPGQVYAGYLLSVLIMFSTVYFF
jgi:membrane-associated phospholipid phosphatase